MFDSHTKYQNAYLLHKALLDCGRWNKFARFMRNSLDIFVYTLGRLFV